jgi:hypothetical protein
MKFANASKLDRKSGVRRCERGAPVDSLLAWLWMSDGDNWQGDEACLAGLMPDSLRGFLIVVRFCLEDVGHKCLWVAIV